MGKNLEIGDVYTYKICDPSAILNYSAESYHYFTNDLPHNSNLCYTVTLDFVDVITSDENEIDGNVWIVQDSIVESTGNLRNSIFHIYDDSWEVVHQTLIQIQYDILILFKTHCFQFTSTLRLNPNYYKMISFGVKLPSTMIQCKSIQTCMKT